MIDYACKAWLAKPVTRLDKYDQIIIAMVSTVALGIPIYINKEIIER